MNKNLLLYLLLMLRIKRPFLKSAGIAALLLITLIFASCQSYPPSFDINQFYNSYNEKVDFTDNESYIVVTPKNTRSSSPSDTGIIFYPGGLVDYHSYLPLMTRCAEKGFVCYIVKMPHDFAFMDRRAAGRFVSNHPEIKKWYVAGHSLGGAMAASYYSKHKNNFEGLILLASYSTRNISDSNTKVLSIYGSNDTVLNLENYQKYKRNLPSVGDGLTEIVINGGNHSQFANYGLQEGDGKAEISSDEQQRITAEEISLWAGI